MSLFPIHVILDEATPICTDTDTMDLWLMGCSRAGVKQPLVIKNENKNKKLYVYIYINKKADAVKQYI